MKKRTTLVTLIILITILILKTSSSFIENRNSDILRDTITSLQFEKSNLETKTSTLKRENENLIKENEKLIKENKKLEQQLSSFSTGDHFQAVFYSYLDVYSEERDYYVQTLIPFYFYDSSNSSFEVTIDSRWLSCNHLDFTGIILKDLSIKYDDEVVYEYPIMQSKVYSTDTEYGIMYYLYTDDTFYEHSPTVTITSMNDNTYTLQFSFSEYRNP